MSCSCQIAKKVTFANPVSNKITAKTVQQLFSASSDSMSSSVGLSSVPTTHQTYKQIQQQLDISSNTKPDELCFNCVRKHLGLAYMFFQKGGDKLYRTAIGQLMCASLHLKQEYPNLAYRVQDVAIRLLRQKDKDQSISVIKQLIQVFLQDPRQDLPQYPPLPMLPEQQELLTLLLVYSLLFVQISYQPQNIFWAVSNLSYFAYSAFRSNNSLQQYQNYRALWKLIQSMSLLDQNYVAARDYLASLIASKYPLYMGITVQNNQQRFKQQYAQQETLLKQLQPIQEA